MNESGRSPWGAAIGGGIIGSVLTAAILALAGPSLFGERMVREALLSNPEMIMDAGDALRDKQFAQTLTPIRASLETPFHSSWKGAAKPDVTMTYFFDYACGYCRQSNPDIERLLAEDKGLRVVYRELFPKGLTLLDLGAIGEPGIAHVAARQELREMVAGLSLPDWPAVRAAAG